MRARAKEEKRARGSEKRTMSQRTDNHDALQSPFLPFFTLPRSSLAKLNQSGSHPAIRNARISILPTRQLKQGKWGGNATGERGRYLLVWLAWLASFR